MATSEASLSTRVHVWWDSVPLVTRCILATCVGTFAVSSLVGGFSSVCLAAQPILHGQLWRLFTAALWHGGPLHLLLNMLALIALGPPLERQLGSLQFAWVTLLLCVLGGAVYTAVATLASFLPPPPLSFLDFGHQCAVGFSGVLCGYLVMEAHLSPVAARSLFGVVSVPAQLYPLALILVWQLLVPHASLLGHLSGLAVGYLYCLRLLSWAVPSSAAIQAAEQSAACGAFCIRSPSFIAHTAATQGDSLLPTSARAGYSDLGSPRSPRWLPYLPFPPSTQRLSDLFASPSQPQAPPTAAPQGQRLGGSSSATPPEDAKAAAAAAAEARLAGQGGSGAGKS